MVCCIPKGVDIKAAVPSKVNREGRVVNNKVSAAVFAGVVLAQLILSFICIGSAATNDDFLACMKTNNFPVFDLTAHLSDSFGEAIERYVGVMIPCIFLIIGFGVLWIFLLQKFAKVITWGTVFGAQAALIALAIWLITENANDAAYGLLVIFAINCIIIYVKRKAVTQAANMLRQAAFTVEKNPGLIGMSIVIQCVLVAYSSIIIAGVATSFLAGKYVVEGNWCVIEPASWTSGARTFIDLTFVWVLFTIMMIRAYMVGGTTALWYWHNTEDIPNKACKTLTWAMTSGFGTCAISGAVVTVMDWLNRQAQSKLANCVNCCNPLWWAFRVLMCYLKEFVNAITKFTVIMAAITGEDFFVSAGKTYYTLKGKFSTLFVVDGVAKLVLYSGAFIASCLIFFISWTLCATIIDAEDPFYKMNQMEPGVFSVIIKVCLWVLSFLFMYMPLLGILCVILLGQLIFSPFFGSAFAIGLFIGCLSMYILTFFASVVLDVTSAMFCIVSIDRKNDIVPVGDKFTEGTPACVGQYYISLVGEPTVKTIDPAPGAVQSQEVPLVQMQNLTR